MFKISFRFLALAGVAAGMLAGCDNREPEATQAAGGSASQVGGASDGAPSTASLSGVVNRHLAGEPIPEVVLADPHGKKLQLAEMDGPVLLNLWATWCAPCVVEMPLLDELAGDMKGELHVITVSEDLQGAEAVVPFFEARDLDNLPQWLDPGNALAASYGGGAVLPLTVLYDAEGKEVWRVMGGYDWASEEARAAIVEGLNESGN